NIDVPKQGTQGQGPAQWLHVSPRHRMRVMIYPSKKMQTKRHPSTETTPTQTHQRANINRRDLSKIGKVPLLSSISCWMAPTFVHRFMFLNIYIYHIYMIGASPP